MTHVHPALNARAPLRIADYLRKRTIGLSRLAAVQGGSS